MNPMISLQFNLHCQAIIAALFFVDVLFEEIACIVRLCSAVVH